MRAKLWAVVAIGLPLVAAAWAQPPEVPPPPAPPTRVEAKKQVIVHWSLGEQAWDFSEILSLYEPEKGFLELRGGDFRPRAVWTLCLLKNLEPGAVSLQQNVPGSPFEVKLLDEDRTVIDDEPRPVSITPISGVAGDSVTIMVELPSAPALNDVKLVRVRRRTNVGF